MAPSIFTLTCMAAFGWAWLTETPNNLDEPRVKRMPGFAPDGSMTKPMAKIFPPMIVTLPILIFYQGNRQQQRVLGQTQIIGLVMIFMAHVLMRWVQAHAGRFYTFDRSIKIKHELVTTGPYQYVQNLGYLAMLTTCMGVCIFTEFAWTNLLPLCVISIVLSDLPLEEKMLKDHFGKQYENFQSTRPRLLPGVY